VGCLAQKSNVLEILNETLFFLGLSQFKQGEAQVLQEDDSLDSKPEFKLKQAFVNFTLALSHS